MLLWMVVYHILQKAWGLEIFDWTITDPALITSPHAFINASGRLDMYSPNVLFPYFSFFMPWFFYKSGIFFRHLQWRELINKDARKLLKTYLIWGTIAYVLYVTMCFIDGTASIRQLVYLVVKHIVFRGNGYVNGPLWFLLTLFGVHVLGNAMLPSNDEGKAQGWKIHLRCFLIVLFGYIIAFLAYKFRFDLLPSWIANVAAGLSFYTLGYWCRKYEAHPLLYIPCLAVYGICCIFGFNVVDMFSNKLESGIYLLWIPTAGCCIIAFNTLCRWFMELIQRVQAKLSKTRSLFVEKVGIHAMPIFVTHFMILQVYVWAVYTYEFSAPHLLILSGMMAALIVGIVAFEGYKPKLGR